MPEINSPTDILMFIKSVGEFLLFTVVFKYIIVHWIAEQLVRIFKYFFVRSKREVAIWIHYRNQAMNKGHKHDTPIDCEDEWCRII